MIYIYIYHGLPIIRSTSKIPERIRHPFNRNPFIRHIDDPKGSTSPPPGF